MKPLIVVLFIFISVLFTACLKTDNASDFPVHGSPLLGKWNIITDSMINPFFLSPSIIYSGVPGDYFDVRLDGYAYVKEGAKMDTLGYVSLTDTTLNLQGFGITLNGNPETSYITDFTTHSATITAPTIFIPAGLVGRTIVLSK